MPLWISCLPQHLVCEHHSCRLEVCCWDSYRTQHRFSSFWLWKSAQCFKALLWIELKVLFRNYGLTKAESACCLYLMLQLLKLGGEMQFCLRVPWKVPAGSCRQTKRLSHCWVSKLTVPSCACGLSEDSPAVFKCSLSKWPRCCTVSDELLLIYGPVSPFLFCIRCVGEGIVEFQGIKQLRILAVNFHFCLCISGDCLVGRGINHAEGSVTEGNPVLPGLYYLFSV